MIGFHTQAQCWGVQQSVYIWLTERGGRVGQKKEKVYEFQDQLKKGQKAESEFYELFKDKLEREDGYIQDFTIKKNGKKIELKSDKYYNTGNFFIEKFSYSNVPGGPWQSLSKDIDYYVIWFPDTMSIHVFRTAQLVAYLELNYEKPYMFNVKNASHTTRGFLVKREDLKHLEVNMEDIL